MTDNRERFYGHSSIPGQGLFDQRMQCVSMAKHFEQQCAWKRSEPSATVYIMYAVIIPFLTTFGFFANFLNAFVFVRPKMTPSVFTYLAVLSWIDCLCCLIILLTSLSRSVFFGSINWMMFDFEWQPPLFGILTGGANWILAAITLDRIIYLRNGLPRSPPKFCSKRIAKRNIWSLMVMSTLLNIPYFFVFVVREDGAFYATSLYFSNYYKIHNWLSFMILCIIPGLFLLTGNTIVIIIFRRWVKSSKALQRPDIEGNARLYNRHRHQVKLTITVILVVFLYLIGELPAHITSRKNAINILFGGDPTKVHFQTVEQFEVIFLALNALQLSFNIIVYSSVNPAFMTEFMAFVEETTNSILTLLGLNALYKGWRNFRNRNRIRDTNLQMETASRQENQVAASYYDETVPEVHWLQLINIANGGLPMTCIHKI